MKCRYCPNSDLTNRMFLTVKGITPALDWYQCWECEYRQLRYFALYDQADALFIDRTGKLPADHADRCSGCALCERGD